MSSQPARSDTILASDPWVLSTAQRSPFWARSMFAMAQMALPVGEPIRLILVSKDVIHSFFLPEFRVKQDAVPGMTTHIWFDGNTVGHWEIACAELCGLGHYRMKGFITVEPQEEFDKWLAEQDA